MKAIAIIERPSYWGDCPMIERKRATDSYICHVNGHRIDAEFMETYCVQNCPLKPLDDVMDKIYSIIGG